MGRLVLSFLDSKSHTRVPLGRRIALCQQCRKNLSSYNMQIHFNIPTVWKPSNIVQQLLWKYVQYYWRLCKRMNLNFLILNKDTGRAITSSSVFVAIKSTSKLKQKEQLLGILIIGPNQVLFYFFTKCTCRIVSIKVSLCNVSFLVQKQQKLSTQTVHKDPDDAHADMDSHKNMHIQSYTSYACAYAQTHTCTLRLVEEPAGPL